jgi:hypothetical protein
MKQVSLGLNLSTKNAEGKRKALDLNAPAQTTTDKMEREAAWQA